MSGVCEKRAVYSDSRSPKDLKSSGSCNPALLATPVAYSHYGGAKVPVRRASYRGHSNLEPQTRLRSFSAAGLYPDERSIPSDPATS